MEEEYLVLLIQDGHQEKMGELWEMVLPIAKKMANKKLLEVGKMNAGLEFDDLVNEGYLALVRAVETYRPEKGKFTSWYWLHARSQCAAAVGFLSSTKKKRDPAVDAASIDAPLESDSHTYFFETIPEEYGKLEMLSDDLFRKSLQQTVRKCVNRLPAWERDVITLIFFHGHAMTSVQQLLRINYQRVRKIRDSAFEMLLEEPELWELRYHTRAIANKVLPPTLNPYRAPVETAAFRDMEIERRLKKLRAKNPKKTEEMQKIKRYFTVYRQNGSIYSNYLFQPAIADLLSDPAVFVIGVDSGKLKNYP